MKESPYRTVTAYKETYKKLRIMAAKRGITLTKLLELLANHQCNGTGTKG